MTADGRLLDGNTGASRPNINVQPYTKADGSMSAWVIVGYEESKGVGVPPDGESNVCKAFLNEPEVLFLDEPTASLDPDASDRVRGLLLRLQRERGVTMVYTSHNMPEVERMCDRVLFLMRGRIVAQGTPAEVVARARSGSLEQVFIQIARDGDLRPAGEAARD